MLTTDKETIDSFRKLRSGAKDVEETVLKFPKYFHIETISACNARCSMCSVNSWSRSKSVMPSDLFDKIIDEIEKNIESVEGIIIQQDGEPLLDKHIEIKIKRLKDIGVKKVSFATNASILYKKRIERLLDSGLNSIDFSIDGTTKETFESIRIGLNFEECLQNIHTFLSLRKNLPIKVRIRMAIQKENAYQFSTFVDYWKPYLRTTDGIMGKIEQKWLNWQEDLQGIIGDDLLLEPSSDLNDSPCISPFDTMVILSDGRVGLCCLDYNASVLMGNIYDQSIEQVWQGNQFSDVRNRHIEFGRNGVSMCVDCHNYSQEIKFLYSGNL